MRNALVLAAALLFAGLLSGAEKKNEGNIRLPKPQLKQKTTLIQALDQRRSARGFVDQDLPLELVSDLLWAACGYNRPGAGLRTVPSCLNSQAIDLYIITRQGVYFFEPRPHRLKLILAGDHRRELAGKQSFSHSAPLTILYVSDARRQIAAKVPEHERDAMAHTDCGFIGQNVYLFCAAEQLATVFRVEIEPKLIVEKLKLDPAQKPLFGQSVGYPGEESDSDHH